MMTRLSDAFIVFSLDAIRSIDMLLARWNAWLMKRHSINRGKDWQTWERPRRTAPLKEGSDK